MLSRHGSPSSRILLHVTIISYEPGSIQTTVKNSGKNYTVNQERPIGWNTGMNRVCVYMEIPGGVDSYILTDPKLEIPAKNLCRRHTKTHYLKVAGISLRHLLSNPVHTQLQCTFLRDYHLDMLPIRRNSRRCTGQFQAENLLITGGTFNQNLGLSELGEHDSLVPSISHDNSFLHRYPYPQPAYIFQCHA